MKIKFICFKIHKRYIIILCIFLLIIVYIVINLLNTLPRKEKMKTVSVTEISLPEVPVEKIKKTAREAKEKIRILPTDLDGFKIIGKIEIPKLGVDKFILSETNSKTLKESVTKLCGPEINTVGNFCIAGHNYNKVFGKIKELKKGDEIIITDIYGKSTIYQVYNNYQTSPKNVTCLEQNTKGAKEITLITCTRGAIKRIIIKASKRD